MNEIFQRNKVVILLILLTLIILIIAFGVISLNGSIDKIPSKGVYIFESEELCKRHLLIRNTWIM